MKKLLLALALALLTTIVFGIPNDQRLPVGYEGIVITDDGSSTNIDAGAPAQDNPNRSDDLYVTVYIGGIPYMKLYEWNGRLYINIGDRNDMYSIQGQGWPVGGFSGVGSSDPNLTGSGAMALRTK